MKEAETVGGAGGEWEQKGVLEGLYSHPGFPMAQTVKHLPTLRKTGVGSLGQEDALEKEMATPFSTLAWKIPWTEEVTVHGVTKSRTRLSN